MFNIAHHGNFCFCYFSGNSRFLLGSDGRLGREEPTATYGEKIGHPHGDVINADSLEP